MDIDLRDDSNHVPQSARSQPRPIKRRRLSEADQSSRIQGAQYSSTSVKGHAASKWRRLQLDYNDQYLSLFRESTQSAVNDLSSRTFEASQIGASFWQPEEKARFFEALARHGRHDLESIAQLVHSKSPFEVKVYLDTLVIAESDRQSFEKQTKNISQAEYLAALEVSTETDEALDRAADALSAFQEQYDAAVGLRPNGESWLIDHHIAASLDEQADEYEVDVAENDKSLDQELQGQPEHALFQLGNMLDLTETVFMKGSRRDPAAHWQELAESGERPAVTPDVLHEMSDIVVNLVRRMVQTTIHVAQSRIRATTDEYHNTSLRVKSEDVRTALDVLNMEHDSWDYWTTLPRRNNVRLVAGSHQRGQSDKIRVSYEQAEEQLGIRHSRGRRRSMSTGSLISQASSGQSSAIGPEHPVTGVETSSDGSEGDYDDVESNVADDTDSNSFDDADEDRAENLKQPMSVIERRRLMDEQHDDYLEAIDMQASKAEDSRLRLLLGFEEAQEIKTEDEGLGRRPNVRRKTLAEVKIWEGSYQAPWEGQVMGTGDPSAAADNEPALPSIQGLSS